MGIFASGLILKGGMGGTMPNIGGGTVSPAQRSTAFEEALRQQQRRLMADQELDRLRTEQHPREFFYRINETCLIEPKIYEGLDELRVKVARWLKV